MAEPSTNQIQEALNFSRFRFKWIEFLKLPSDILEPALRDVLERTCCGVHKNYLTRAMRVEAILRSEDTLKMSASSATLRVWRIAEAIRQPDRQYCRPSDSGQGTHLQLLAG